LVWLPWLFDREKKRSHSSGKVQNEAVKPLVINDTAQQFTKPTVTRVTPFAAKANPAPRYGSLVPPLYLELNKAP